MPQTIRIGTRGSQLALWQAHHIAALLNQAYPDRSTEIVTFTTRGDKILDKPLPQIGGKGLFTEELERSLLEGEIDCAVHSLKDLPTENPSGLTIGAIPERAPVEDVLISKHDLPFDQLPQGAKIGTSSLRRAAQLRAVRPDITILDIRGNVPTRIEKAFALDGAYDAIILARAGVVRLGLAERITQILPFDLMLPAPGQGAIGVQCKDEAAMIELFAAISHPETKLAVTAERAFLNRLEGGCSVPVAAHATYEQANLYLTARVSSVDGKTQVENSANVSVPNTRSLDSLFRAATLGTDLALDALSDGADEILAEVRNDIAG